MMKNANVKILPNLFCRKIHILEKFKIPFLLILFLTLTNSVNVLALESSPEINHAVDSDHSAQNRPPVSTQQNLDDVHDPLSSINGIWRSEETEDGYIYLYIDDALFFSPSFPYFNIAKEIKDDELLLLEKKSKEVQVRVKFLDDNTIEAKYWQWGKKKISATFHRSNDEESRKFSKYKLEDAFGVWESEDEKIPLKIFITQDYVRINENEHSYTGLLTPNALIFYSKESNKYFAKIIWLDGDRAIFETPKFKNKYRKITP
jgi:hypothetical protein